MSSSVAFLGDESLETVGTENEFLVHLCGLRELKVVGGFSERFGFVASTMRGLKAKGMTIYFLKTLKVKSI